jgi:hypothetical protein
MLYVEDGAGNEVALTYYHSNKPDGAITFLKLDTLQGKYGVDFVRNVLGVDDFRPSATRIKEGRAEFQNHHHHGPFHVFQFHLRPFFNKQKRTLDYA